MLQEYEEDIVGCSNSQQEQCEEILDIARALTWSVELHSLEEEKRNESAYRRWVSMKDLSDVRLPSRTGNDRAPTVH